MHQSEKGKTRERRDNQSEEGQSERGETTRERRDSQSEEGQPERGGASIALDVSSHSPPSFLLGGTFLCVSQPCCARLGPASSPGTVRLWSLDGSDRRDSGSPGTQHVPPREFAETGEPVASLSALLSNLS